MTARGTIWALGAAFLAVVGAHAADTAIPLGQTLAGESCSIGRMPGSDMPEAIACGATADAGTVLMVPLPQGLPAEAAARHAAILTGAKALLASGMSECGEPQWLANDSALFFCTVRSTRWPRIAIVTGAGTSLYTAQGLPSMYPVLENAIAKLSGGSASQAGLPMLQAKFASGVLNAGAGDFGSYTHLVEQGRLYSGADNFAQAEASYRDALAIEVRLFGPDSAAAGSTLSELALQVSNQGRFDEAQALFQRATPIIEGTQNPVARARLASYRALDAANQRHFEEALKFAREATAARRAAAEEASAGGSPSPEARGELAHSLRIEAEMALRLGDLPTAQASADEALWIISDEPGLPLWWRPDAVSLMGEVNARAGRVVTAERDFRDARDLDRKLFGDTGRTARADMRLGAFYSSQQVYPAAVDAYHAAFAILAGDPVARSEVTPDEIVPFIAATSAIGGPDDEIFRASQLARSDVADQAIARVAARRAAGEPAVADLVRQADDAVRLRDRARMDLAAEFAKPDDERNSARERKLDADVRTASLRTDELASKLRTDFPAYAKLADPGPGELSAVRAALAADQAFVSFVVGASQSFALVVTGKGLVVRKLDIGADQLSADIAALRGSFVPKLGRLPDFSIKASFALYSALLGPLEGDLAGVDHLVVAASGDLANLPLALLVTAAPRDGAEHDYKNAAWLIRRMAISEVPSARAFVLLRAEAQNSATAPRPFFGVADPAFLGTAANAGAMAALAQTCESGAVSPALIRALPPLPDTRREVSVVGSALGAQPGSVLTGEGANEGSVRAAPLDQYRVVYFATHGLLPGELRCQAEPGLALSPPSQRAASARDDGVLYASEIASLKLNADLVVLSACNTAAAGGTRFGGGALEGLADAFFNAGARAVLASHWSVPSAATTRLMTNVFARPEGDLAQALRQAQLAMIAQGPTAHPFNWAAFTLIGNAGGAATPTKTARGGSQ
jgi:CHAT domain-containing protein